VNILQPLTYTDPIIGLELRAYADDRGFAQLTISKPGAPLATLAVRIRDEDLDRLIDVLNAARAAEQPEGSDRGDR
jgi:hypothetical protein